MDQVNELEKKINELIDKRNKKVGLLRKEKTRGWEIGVKYKVEDIISLCWLEILQGIQHNLPAKRCSLCSNIFLVYGKKILLDVLNVVKMIKLPGKLIIISINS